MRRAAGIAALAVVAAATTGMAGTSTVNAAPKDPAITALSNLKSHPTAARASDGQAFEVKNAIVDKDGTTHVRMDRTYEGLRVIGGDLVVHQGPNAGFKGISQTLKAPLTLSTDADVAAGPAASKALAPNKVNRSITGLKRQGSPELVVDATGAQPRLVWEVITGGLQKDGTPSRLATYVDAKSGALVRSEQGIQTADGSGNTLYSGTVPLQVTQSGSTYSLKDATRGGGYTNDVNNGEDLFLFCQLFGIGCVTGTTVTSSSTTFGNGSNSNRATAAADAQYGTNVTWDYFKNIHGRNGIWNDGKGAWNRVHYGNAYVNAFWDGSKMTYGDGDGTNYGPLVSLDVAGHEMTHGVTENSANLTYSGESGGLNEATSDVFGSLVEAHAANTNDAADYYIGEEFDLAQGDGFRRMDKPSSDGNSVDCWSSGVGNLDVHYSSGVGNHAFYLLAEGSGAKTIGGKPHNSPTCNGSTVTGIGSAKAGKIWYRALTTYWTSSTNYSQARAGMLKAATDLYGAGSVEYNTTAAAWSAVSVN